MRLLAAYFGRCHRHVADPASLFEASIGDIAGRLEQHKATAIALLLAVFALLVSTWWSPVYAQTSPTAPLSDQSGVGTSTVELQPVFVEAPRAEHGPGVSPNGANSYGVTSTDIENLPAGQNTTITDVLTQIPGVAIDQNQQIHIRNTEGPQFQYQINGVLIPLDINTNPPFISMLNSMFVSKADLLDGILPARYSYATGGVVDIQTKDGCTDTGGSASLLLGQRTTIQPSAQYAGCNGNLSYYVNGTYERSNTAFNSATPEPNAIHDRTEQGQTFGYFSYPLNNTTKLSLIASAAASSNQLPNVPGLPQEYMLAGYDSFQSAAIDSYLDFRDYLAIFTLSGAPSTNLSYQVAYAAHSISQKFDPDNPGELIFQGVASRASHNDLDNTLQGDLTYKSGAHTLSSGFYLGEYRVIADDTSLVFPADLDGNQTSNTPVTVVSNTHATNIVSGIYVNDLWQIDEKLRLNAGLRWDDLTGFTKNNQFDPTLNLAYALTPKTTVHGGVARYLQVPSFQGISADASVAFAGTTGAAGPPGIATPFTEDDRELDAGIVHHLTPRITLSQDAFFEQTLHYLDTGQFGVVPIFAPFNYVHGTIWGSETAVNYTSEKLSVYGSATLGRNLQRGVATGQSDLDSDEITYIEAHHIVLDHQPLYGASAGASYKWWLFSLNLDGIYSSGLRGGFADQDRLPTVLQFNAGGQITFRVPGIGKVTDRITALNLLDRVNLIRPAEGIGIFQSAYGPRRTLSNTLIIPF